MTNAVAGLEIEFAGNPFQLQGAYGTKVFYTDEEGIRTELKDVMNFSIPQTGHDDLLYTTITMPLLNIKFKGDSQ